MHGRGGTAIYSVHRRSGQPICSPCWRAHGLTAGAGKPYARRVDEQMDAPPDRGRPYARRAGEQVGAPPKRATHMLAMLASKRVHCRGAQPMCSVFRRSGQPICFPCWPANGCTAGMGNPHARRAAEQVGAPLEWATGMVAVLASKWMHRLSGQIKCSLCCRAHGCTAGEGNPYPSTRGRPQCSFRHCLRTAYRCVRRRANFIALKAKGGWLARAMHLGARLVARTQVPPHDTQTTGCK